MLAVQARLSAQCFLQEPVVIKPLITADVLIEVQGLEFTNLSSDQSLCAVSLQFEHDRLENIRLTLISPSGQEITLLGPGSISANVSLAINWDITQTQCGFPAIPDAGISATWDNAEPWSSFTNYTGTYYPNQGCLEDIDIGSAEGTWVIRIENLGTTEGTLIFAELIFCNGSAPTCSTCFLDAGLWQESAVSFCEGDPALLTYIPAYLVEPTLSDTDQTVQYFLFEDADLVGTSEFIPDLLSELPAARYILCGVAASEAALAVLLTDEGGPPVMLGTDLTTYIDSDTLCADMSAPCLFIDILPVSLTTTINNFLCVGDSVEFGSVVFYGATDTIFYTYDQGSACTHKWDIDLIEVEVAAEIEDLAAPLACGESAFLDASASTSTDGNITAYNWTTADGNYTLDIGPRAQVDQAGTYYLEVLAGICSDRDTIVVESQDTFELLFQTIHPGCSGQSSYKIIIASPANIDFQIESVTGPTIDIELIGDTISVVESGIYYVTTSAGSCLRMDTIQLTDDLNPLTVNLSVADTIDCLLTSVELVIESSVSDYTVMYAGPEPIPDNAVLPQVSLPGTYMITITDANSCTATAAVEVIAEDAVPLISLTDQVIPCTADELRLEAIIAGAVDSVLWTGPDNFFSRQQLPLVTATGSYFITVWAPSGCFAMDSLVVTESSNRINFEFSDRQLTCLSDTVVICLESLVSDEPILAYNWADANLNTLSVTSCAELTEAGLYFMTITDNDRCLLDTFFMVEDLREDLSFELSSQAPFYSCDTTQQMINSHMFDSESVISSWFLDGELIEESGARWISISSGGLYTLELYDSISHCMAVDSLYLPDQDSSLSAIQLAVVQENCDGPSWLLLTGDISTLAEVFVNAVSYPPSDSIWLSDIDSQISLLDDMGCSRDTIIVLAQGLTVIDLGPDTTLIAGNSYQLPSAGNSEDAWSYNWSHPELLSCTNCLDPTITPASTIELTLEITDAQGCQQADTVIISVIQPTEIYFPTVFQPTIAGPDGIYSIVLDAELYSALSCRIYDRWGNLVADYVQEVNQNITEVWDGNYGDQKAEMGVYIYMAELLHIDGVRVSEVGTLTLIR